MHKIINFRSKNLFFNDKIQFSINTNFLGCFFVHSRFSKSNKCYNPKFEPTRSDPDGFITNEYQLYVFNCLIHDQWPIKTFLSEKGRGLVATRNIKKGEVVSVEKPFVTYNLTEEICSNCCGYLPQYGTITDPVTGHSYCCKECKQQNFDEFTTHIHSNPKLWEKFESHVLNDKRIYSLMAAKVFLKINHKVTMGEDFYDIWKPYQLLAAADHNEFIWQKDYDLLSDAIFEDDETKEVFRFEWFARILQHLYINSLTIHLPFHQDVAKGLYCISSLYNHSCIENVEPVFQTNHELKMIATHNIAEGDELFINYLATETMSREEKFSFLVQHYGFKCNCAHCLKVQKQLENDPEQKVIDETLKKEQIANGYTKKKEEPKKQENKLNVYKKK